jgi:hypothetical protein
VSTKPTTVRKVTAGASCSKLSGDRRQHEPRRGGNDADADVPAIPSPIPAISSLRVLDIEAHALSPLQQNLSAAVSGCPGRLSRRGRRRSLPRGASRCSSARLRPVELGRCRPTMLKVGDGLEVAEVTKVHCKSPLMDCKKLSIGL